MPNTAKKYKLIGLFLAIVMPVLVAALRMCVHGTDDGFSAGSYFVFIAPFLLLLGYILYVEKESLGAFGNMSINLRTLGSAFVILFASAVAFILFAFTISKLGITQAREPMYEKMQQLPIAVRLLVAVWAGVSEEIAFRGYAITRLEELTGSASWAAVLPVVLFALGHGTDGSVVHIVFALTMGALFSIFYLMTRNLMANILAHALIDILLLVVLPMLNS